MNPSTNWPTVTIVPEQQRRVVARAAVAYNEKVHKIAQFLASASAALADHDYDRAGADHHEAWLLMNSGLRELIDEAHREVCMDEDKCGFCGARYCECDDDVDY